MNIDHCIRTATLRALDWDDLPDQLLPLVIVSEVAQLSGLENEAMGHSAWH